MRSKVTLLSTVLVMVLLPLLNPAPASAATITARSVLSRVTVGAEIGATPM